MSEHMVKNTDFVMKKYAEAYAKNFKKVEDKAVHSAMT